MALYKANFMRRFHIAAHVLTYNTLQYLNLRRVLAISMRTRYDMYTETPLWMWNRAHSIQPRHFLMLYRNKYLDSVCTRDKTRMISYSFFYDRRRRFLAPRKSGRGREHKTETFPELFARANTVSFCRRNAYFLKNASSMLRIEKRWIKYQKY